jgi:hypothetical protein
LGQQKQKRPTTKEEPSGKVTVVALSSGRIAPEARNRDTPTEGKSSIAFLMSWRNKPPREHLQPTH